LGTPTEAYKEEGAKVWHYEQSTYGGTEVITGDINFIPFRYQGQYEDAETGLYYNRFRYYSPEEESYISQDPIGLEGGMELYSYVHDTNYWIDPYGLTGIIYRRTNPHTGAVYIGKSKSPEAFKRREAAHNVALKKSTNGNPKKYKFEQIEQDVKGKKGLQNREQIQINKHGGINKLENKINAKKKTKSKRVH